jgi:hypothetical protein
VVAVQEPGLNPYLKIPKHTYGGDYHIVWGGGRAVLYVHKWYSVVARFSIYKPYGYGKSIWNFHMNMDCMDIWITYSHMEINLASGYNTAFQTWASQYTSSHPGL